MSSLIPERFRRREFAIAVVLTVLLWGAALLLWTAQDLFSGEPFSRPYKILLVETFLCGLLFSALLAAIVGFSRMLSRGWSIAVIVSGAVSIALSHGIIDAYQVLAMRAALHLKPADVMQVFYSGLMPFVLIYGLFATALGLMLSEIAVREGQRRLAEAREAAQYAQLAALRFQLNPHFLFNTLNAISSLIVSSRNADAERVTVKLSEFLRLSLEADPNEEVTLDEELATTQSYLDIEAARFADRLQIAFDCPAPLLGACVPSFLLQPLVENSIKYAVAPSRGSVTLTVSASTIRDSLRVVVEDDAQQAFGKLPSGGTGLGLENVRKRLSAFYGARGHLDARSTNRGFVVELTMPLRYAMAQAAE